MRCGAERSCTWTAVVVALFCVNIGVGVAVACIVGIKASQRHTPGTEISVAWRNTLQQVYDEEVFQRTDITKRSASPGLAFLSLLKPIAMFSGLDFDEEIGKHDRNMTQIRNWANDDGADRKLLYNGMAYAQGAITVPATGLYRVFSHVKFYVTNNNKSDSNVRTFGHAIDLYNASSSRQMKLFQSEITECKDGINDGAHLEYPTCVSGVVHLNVGDSLSVSVSHFDLLKSDRDWGYFGAYMI